MGNVDSKVLGAGAAGLAAGVGLAAAAGALKSSDGSSGGKTKPGTDRRGALKEFSVVYTDHAVNLMAAPFGEGMRTISAELKEVYQAEACVLIPGSGTYGMEAVARSFGQGKKTLIIRNGYFSYRWSDIRQVCNLTSEEDEIVLKARATDDSKTPQFAPCPVDEVVASIKQNKPAAVFAPHIDTSTGVMLSDDYIKKVTDAVHSVGGHFVLDCIASGCLWVNMKKLGIDAVISAPQKGWSAPASVGIVMLSASGVKVAEVNNGNSFVANLSQWLSVMREYEAGRFKYYTTLPTDALLDFRDKIMEIKNMGWEQARQRQIQLGQRIRSALEKRGYPSVAASGFQSPGVVVSYYPNGSAVADFKKLGVQIAGGVPFKIDEPDGLTTFRLGLFGLTKLGDVDGTVGDLETALDAIGASRSRL